MEDVIGIKVEAEAEDKEYIRVEIITPPLEVFKAEGSENYEQKDDPLLESRKHTRRGKAKTSISIELFSEKDFDQENGCDGSMVTNVRQNSITGDERTSKMKDRRGFGNDQIPFRQPKCKGPAEIASNPLEAWLTLFDNLLQTELMNRTNEEIRKKNYRRAHERTTDLIELKSWFGLIYLCGVFRNSKDCGPLEELWTSELGNTVFRTTMSYKRFEFLMDHITFSKKPKNLIEYMEDIWERFIINCRSHYSPGIHCVIESMKNQPEAYLSNFDDEEYVFASVCDSETLYMSNAVFAPKTATKEEIVLHLISDLKGSRRSVILNEIYTSDFLIKLLSNSDLHAVGAVSETNFKAPQKVLQSDFKESTLYSEDSSLHFGISNDISPSGCLISTNYPQNFNVKQLYSKSVKSCQEFFKCTKMYSTRNCRTSIAHWSLEFLYFILDIAAVNAWILLRLSSQHQQYSKSEQRDFQRKLGLYLTHQQLKRRLSSDIKLSPVLKFQISELLGVSPTGDLVQAEAFNTKDGGLKGMRTPEGDVKLQSKVRIDDIRRSCRGCPVGRRAKTRHKCQQCGNAMCLNCLILRCPKCTGVRKNI